MGRRAGAWPRRFGRCCLSSPDGNHRCCPSSRSTAGAAAGCSAGPAIPTGMWPRQCGPAPHPRHEPFLSPRVQFAVLQPHVMVSPPVPPIPPSLLRVRLGTRAAQALRTPASVAGNDLHLQGAAPHTDGKADCSGVFTRIRIKGSLTLRCVTSEQRSHGYFYAIKPAGHLPSAFLCFVPSPAHLPLSLCGLHHAGDHAAWQLSSLKITAMPPNKASFLRLLSLCFAEVRLPRSIPTTLFLLVLSFFWSSGGGPCFTGRWKVKSEYFSAGTNTQECAHELLQACLAACVHWDNKFTSKHTSLHVVRNMFSYAHHPG